MKVLLRAVVCVACLAGAAFALGATPEDCHALRKHGHRAEAQKCYESLTTARDPYLRAEGYWGMEMYQDANNQFRAAVGAIARERHDIACAGAACCTNASTTPKPRTLFNEALAEGPEKRASLSTAWRWSARTASTARPSNIRKRRSDLDPKLVEAHELMANLLLEDSDEDKGVCRSGRGAEDFSRSARCHGHPCGHRSSGRPLARCVARENSPGQSRLRRRLRARRASSGAQPPLRGRHRLLPQGDRSGPAAVVRALAAGHQPDAPGPGRRAAQAAGNVLRQRLPQRRDRQQPAPAR